MNPAETTTGTAATMSGTTRTMSGMGSASSGMTRTMSGTGSASSGTDRATPGMGSTSSGTDRAMSGMGLISSGTDRAMSGMGLVSSGTDRAMSGMGSASSGTDRAMSGMGSTSSGTDRATSGTGWGSSGTDRAVGGSGLLKVAMLFAAGMVFGMVSGCGPIYDLRYEYAKPSGADRVCFSQCVTGRSHCRQLSRLADANRERDAALCAAIASGEKDAAERRRRLAECRLALPPRPAFPDGDCERDYNDCFIACGGTVTEIRECVANCGE